MQKYPMCMDFVNIMHIFIAGVVVAFSVLIVYASQNEKFSTFLVHSFKRNVIFSFL